MTNNGSFDYLFLFPSYSRLRWAFCFVAQLVCIMSSIDMPAHAVAVRIDYVAKIATISGTPFGLDANLDRTSTVTGSFQYENETNDQNSSAERGDYPHDPNEGGIGGGGFIANFAPNTMTAFSITGSAVPMVNIEDFSFSETFRFRDGPDTFNPGGIMLVNGLQDSNIRLNLSISDSSASSFPNDSLPDNPFPIQIPPSSPHTFLLREIDTGDVVLLQFESLLPGVHEPITPGDYDGDGKVNGIDFLLWQRQPNIGSLADWEANYGTVASLTAASAAIPESTTCTLALAALCLAMSRRWT